MAALLALLGAGSAGLVLSAGLAISTRLRQSVKNPSAVTLINFSISFVILLILFAVGVVGPVSLERLANVPWWAFLGGLAGGTYVTLGLLAVGRLGLATSTLSIVCGQVIMSLIIDYFGLLGVQTRTPSITKLLGIGLILIAVRLTHHSASRTA